MFSATSLTFSGLVQNLIGLINAAIPVLAGIALALFLVSGIRYITAAGRGEKTESYRSALLWSLIAVFVLVSIYGILSFLSASFLGSSLTGASRSTAGKVQQQSNYTFPKNF